MLVKDLSPRPADRPPATVAAQTQGESPQQPPKLSHGVPAWLLSFTLHATLLIALGFLVRVSQRGALLEPGRGGGIVLARDVDGAAEYFGEGDDYAEATTTQSPQDGDATAAALPSGEAPPIDLAGALPNASEASRGAESGVSMPAAGSLTSSGGRPNRGQPGGDQTKTSIFGAEGIGNKFVYVFDRSASMDGYQGRPLRAAKSELSASLEDLDRIHQFQIIFYNDQPTVFNPQHPLPPQMLFGDEQTKRLAQKFVNGIVAAGGTRHMDALKLALAMHPDVIFFLTDAAEPQLSPSDLAAIRRQNNRVNATIHAIEFGAGPDQGGMNFLKRLALQNGGTRVYVDVTRLPTD